MINKEEIIEYFRLGKSRKEIAKIYDISRCTLSRKMKEFGISQPRYISKDRIKLTQNLSEYSSKWHINNKESTKLRTLNTYSNQKENEPWVLLYRGAKYRAKKKNLTFDIDINYVKELWTDICPILNIPLFCNRFQSGLNRTTNKSKPSTNSPTLDRIDSTKGYVKGNLCVISYRANMIKNCGNLEEHKKIVEFLEKHENKALILPTSQ